MGLIAQSVGWWCFVPKLMTPEQFVQTTREAGFTAIDLVPPDYRQLVIGHGLKVSSIQGHMPLEIGLNQRELHDRLAQEIGVAVAEAARLQIPNVLCFSGNRNGLDDAAGRDAVAAGLARVARAAEAAGVTLVLELLNSKVDHPDYQADHTAWGVEICRAVGSPSVKLLYDIYHMQIMEGDLIRTIQTVHPFIGLYHTAGNPGRHELDEEQEINYPAVLKAIRDTGYQGFIAHEFIPRGDAATALRTVFDQTAPYVT